MRFHTDILKWTDMAPWLDIVVAQNEKKLGLKAGAAPGSMTTHRKGDYEYYDGQD